MHTSQECIIYTRVSSEEQREQGYSIDAQLGLLKNYAKVNGLKVLTEYKETASAKDSGTRAMFNEIVDYLKGIGQDKPVLLVEKTDRLSRNQTDYDTIINTGVDVVFVKENKTMNKESPSNDILLQDIMLAVSKHKVNLLSEEVKKGMNQKVKMGGYPGKAPIGYINRPSNGKNIITLDKDYAPLVQELFEDYASGLHSISSLVKKYNKEVNRLNLNRNFSKSTVHRLLSNPFYTGVFEWKGQIHQGSHDSLVSTRLFRKARSLLKKRKDGVTQIKKEIKTFQGIAKCSKCGCFLTPDKKKNKYIYYLCKKCKQKTYIREEKIDLSLIETLNNWDLPEKVRGVTKAYFTNSKKATIKNIQDNISREKQSHSKAIKRRSGLLDSFLDGIIDEETYKLKDSAYISIINETSYEIKKLEALFHLESNNRNLTTLVKHFVANYNRLSIVFKRKVINMLFKSIELIDGKIQCSFNEPFSYFLT